MNKDSRLVYSTERGRIRDNASHHCPPNQGNHSGQEGDGVVRIFKESRKGSGVSLIKGLPANDNLKALAKTLKKKLGVGGSVKSGVIEIQTDQRDKIKALLETAGYTVKIAGG